MSHNTISFWLHSVIHHTYSYAFGDNCRDLRVRAFQVKLYSTSGSEGRDLVLPDNVLHLLPERCRPQAYGYLLHRACGVGSAGRITH